MVKSSTDDWNNDGNVKNEFSVNPKNWGLLKKYIFFQVLNFLLHAHLYRQ